MSPCIKNLLEYMHNAIPIEWSNPSSQGLGCVTPSWYDHISLEWCQFICPWFIHVTKQPHFHQQSKVSEAFSFHLMI